MTGNMWPWWWTEYFFGYSSLSVCLELQGYFYSPCWGAQGNPKDVIFSSSWNLHLKFTDAIFVLCSPLKGRDIKLPG